MTQQVLIRTDLWPPHKREQKLAYLHKHMRYIANQYGARITHVDDDDTYDHLITYDIHFDTDLCVVSYGWALRYLLTKHNYINQVIYSIRSTKPGQIDTWLSHLQ